MGYEITTLKISGSCCGVNQVLTLLGCCAVLRWLAIIQYFGTVYQLNLQNGAHSLQSL